MTKETMLNLIEKHNGVVQFIETLGDVKVSAEVFMRLMPLSSRIASLGLALTHEAREIGIDAKCCMQSGKINILSEKIETPAAGTARESR